MKIELRSLRISNFKGIRRLELTFRSGINSLLGANASGKTTVYDALTWLLFDKDSRGNGRFTVKPVGVSGAMPTVEAVLLVNGEGLKLKKQLREKWEKRRGSGESRFAGNTVDYWVEDVPRKESEYKRIIAGYLDEERFRLLTNVYEFAQNINWKKRREQLAEICGLPSDRNILDGAPNFAPLADHLGTRTVEEYKSALITKRKGINADLDALPVRLDECRHLVSQLSELDISRATEEKQKAQMALNDLLTERARVDGGAALTAAKAEQTMLQARLKALESENQQYRTNQMAPIVEEQARRERQVNDAKRASDAAAILLDRLEHTIEKGNRQLEEYRARWKEIDRETLPTQLCPACGQAMPEEKRRTAQERWAARQQERKDQLLADSQIIKENLRSWEADLARARLEQQACEIALEQAMSEQDAASAEQSVVEDLPDYDQVKRALLSQLGQAKDRLSGLQQDAQKERERLDQNIGDAFEQIARADEVLSRHAQLLAAQNRERELTLERERLGKVLSELEQEIELCERFSRYRAQTVEQAVNSKFRLVTFRLFTEQINGGMADCCDVMVDGVPYADVNSAMKINAGLDVIQTLARHYQLAVPLFIDNAESVSELYPIDTQVIRLVVSEKEKELKLV